MANYTLYGPATGSQTPSKPVGPKTPNAAIEKTPPPIWSNLTDDKLATVDVYKQTQSGTINPISDFANQFDFGFAGLLKGGAEIAGKLNTALKFYSDVRKAVNEGISLDRLGSLGTAVKSGLAGMGVDVKSDLFQRVEATSDFLIKTGQQVHRVKNTNWKDLNSAIGMINHLSGGADGLFQLSDLGAQSQYVVTLVNQMTRMGIPNSLDSLKTLIKDSPLLTDILKGVLPETLAFLDTDGLKTIQELAGSELFRSLKGNLLEDFSSRYNDEIRAKYEGRTDTDWYNSFKSLSLKVDPQSFYTIRLGKKIPDLSKVIGGSYSFKEMLHAGSRQEKDDLVYLGMVTVFNNQNVKSDLQKNFPRIQWEDNVVNVPQHGNPLDILV